MSLRVKRHEIGIAVVEVLIGTVVLAILVFGAYNAVDSAGDTMGTVLQRTSLHSKVRDSIQHVGDSLKRAGNIEIDNSDADADALTFQIPLSVTNGQISWGGREYTTSGGKTVTTPRTGHWLQYAVVTRSIDETRSVRQLVLRCLDATQTTAVGEDEVVAEFIASAGAEGKGFSVGHAGNLFTIQIRIQREQAGTTGQDVAKGDNCHTLTLKTTVLARNFSGVPTGEAAPLTALVAALNSTDRDQLAIDELKTSFDDSKVDVSGLGVTSFFRTLLMHLVGLGASGTTAAIADARLDATTGTALLNEYVTFARWLATDTMTKAEVTGEAQRSLDDGDGFATAGDHEKAIASYKDALKHAQSEAGGAQ